MLEIREIEKIYPPHVHALRGVNLKVNRGETLALVGESGCGKSTLAKMILRIENPTAGQVLWEGKDLSHLSSLEVAEKIQMIFQDPSSSLNPRKRIRDIVAEPLRIQKKRLKLSESDIQSKVQETLSLVGLNSEMLDRYPHMFSGGQKQRIGIARALVTEPDLIICDEPVSALDPSVQAQVLNLLRELQEKKGMGYLFISHDLHVVRFVAQRVAVMYLGKIVEIQDRAELFRRPRHPYTQLLLESTPEIGKAPRETFLKASELPSPSAPPSGCAFHPRCRWVQDICQKESPELKTLKVAKAACHFAETLDLSREALEVQASPRS